MDNPPKLFKGGSNERCVRGRLGRMKFSQLCLLSLLAVAGCGRALAATPLRAALFPVEFDDTSMQAPQPAELARVKATGDELRKLLAASGRYAFVDVAPVAKEAAARDLYACHGCETGLAKQVGAQVSVVAWVQKVSNLILNINAVIRDVNTGKPVAAGSVDIRGNTDESWSRGVSYLVRNRLLPSPASAP